MERTRRMVAAALLLGAGSFAACATTVDDGTEPLRGVDVDPVLTPGGGGVMPGGQDMHVFLDAGPAPDVDPNDDGLPPDDPSPNPEDTSPFDLCHDVVCGEGEACCPSSGACYPDECFDCCYTVARELPDLGTAAAGTHTGPNDGPAFGGPEPPRVMPSTLPEPEPPKPNE